MSAMKKPPLEKKNEDDYKNKNEQNYDRKY